MLTKTASIVLSKYKEINKSIAESIESCGFEEWALFFFWRIEGINDLHSEDAVYHHTCYSNSKTNKKIPSKYQQPNSKVNRKRGWPKDAVFDSIYDEVCRLMGDMEKIISWLLSLTWQRKWFILLLLKNMNITVHLKKKVLKKISKGKL